MSAPPVSRRRAGFTLLEMLAVLGMTSFVLYVAVQLYRDISIQTELAASRTRDTRRVVAVLDRVARDLEGAVLLQKADGVDPISHPWLFLAEAGLGQEGAERLKFMRRGRRPRMGRPHDSDLEVVSYFLRESEEDPESLELWRWSSPRLPERRELEFPGHLDEGAALLAPGVARFGVRLLTEGGEWQDEWNSSQLSDSGALPAAAEISLALWSEAQPELEPVPTQRRVLIPVRPIDPAQLAAGAEADEDEDEEEDEQADCRTVESCLQDAAVAAAIQEAGVIGEFELDSIPGSECFSDWAADFGVSSSLCE